MGTALAIATGPLGLIAAALAAIAVGIGAVTLASKKAAMINGSAVDRYRSAAKEMVAENEAARIERARAEGRPIPATAAEAPRKTGTGAEAARQAAASPAFPAPVTGDNRAANEAAQKYLQAWTEKNFHGDIGRMSSDPKRYQITSVPRPDLGPLSMDEAYRIQAAIWAEEDWKARSTLKGKELSGYLAASPERITEEEAYRRLRESAAADTGGDEGIPGELKAALKKVDDLLASIDGGIKGLAGAGSPGIPGRLNYAQMGQEDFWSLARAGI
jgi:hypothetical protein